VNQQVVAISRPWASGMLIAALRMRAAAIAPAVTAARARSFPPSSRVLDGWRVSRTRTVPCPYSVVMLVRNMINTKMPSSPAAFAKPRVRPPALASSA
jgi:hypothetical protein